MPGTRFQLEVNPQVPLRLHRLDELANNLWYSWDSPTRTLFARLDPSLWRAVGHSPKALLKRVDQKRLNEAAEDPVFLSSYNRVLSAFDSYHQQPPRFVESKEFGEGDLVAYFCAEFGFHESLPIYSGGLGILAGDHCKTASDLRLPFVGVGLLYRQGYFFQTIDSQGRQHAQYADSEFDDLPISPVFQKGGNQLRVQVPLPGRDVVLKVWQARIGHVRLYLLDSDLPENSEADRGIAHRLYGGDRVTRIEQEILLGMGGVLALAALGMEPTVWHINEGHAAFQILERMRALRARGLDFNAALEVVGCSTVFTTHTAVPAGHDHFGEDMIRRYFDGWCRDMEVPQERLLELGRTPDSADFNMTALAIRGSRFHNGVSRVHGLVSSRICSPLWPQIQAEENPVRYVTNGVHVPTFLAADWREQFDRHLGFGWRQRLNDTEYWEAIQTMPDQQFWAVRQNLKSQLFHLVRDRLALQNVRNQGSEAHLDRLLRLADPQNPQVLTIGFARRFATYKRAALLLEDLDWLREILSDAERPVLFIFAGKAHPADQPGQDLIARIASVANSRDFEGKILMLEGYDLRLARRLVSGVDVWLNNPIFPLEASGTSGMKVAINGGLNLSVLDGWWAEGYDGTNGWAIKPASETLDQVRRNQEESRTLYELLQDSVIPMYYERGPMGHSPRWVAMAKRAIATLLPRFNTERMLEEYLENFYRPAAGQWHQYSRDGYATAREVAQWKARVRAAWSAVRIRRADNLQRRIAFGDSLRFETAVHLNGLNPDDVRVEVLFGRPESRSYETVGKSYAMHFSRHLENGESLFVLELQPELCGKLEYRFRAYPWHPKLTHPFEMGMMAWL